MNFASYETVIGLEVHAELKTKSKIFCACPTAFGARPNTHCCPICMGLPGAMPTLNRRAVELAVMAGLALGCDISEISRIDRKQYFYPDLPKAYQVSQADSPLCRGGAVTVKTDGGERRVGITRIHIEEDAGKLIHQNGRTLIDYNRCGVPLIEIVSAPDMRSGAEAAAYVRALRSILVSCGISDGKMQEGSLRCDVNVSVRRKGGEGLGVRTEIKNLNSFTFMEKAIEYEVRRQCELLENGEEVRMETRRFDASAGVTLPMRNKERVFDYRFLAEPDLPPLCVTREEIEALRRTLPEFPAQKSVRFVREYGLTEYDADVLTAEPALAAYFERTATQTRYAKTAANLLLSELLRVCAAEGFTCAISQRRLAQLADLLGDGVINSSTAKKLLARLLIADLDPIQTVEAEHLAQITDEATLKSEILAVMQMSARAVSDYRAGKKAAMRALQGQVMARTGGLAEPRLLEKLLTDELNRSEKE